MALIIVDEEVIQMFRSLQRTKSIGVKVSETDFATLQTLAEQNGKPLGEWCREALLEWAENQKAVPGEQILLAEILGLRTILVNLFFKLANAEPVTSNEVQHVIERADADKVKKALARLQEADRTLRERGES